MKQARLLLPKKPANQSARCFVEVRKMVAKRPNEAFQFDIKMYLVTGVGWVPCLSVLDIFTRQLKAHLLQRSIQQHDVKALWQVACTTLVLTRLQVNGLTIRDNTKQNFSGRRP